jgi:hypothetical protein
VCVERERERERYMMNKNIVFTIRHKGCEWQITQHKEDTASFKIHATNILLI